MVKIFGRNPIQCQVDMEAGVGSDRNSDSTNPSHWGSIAGCGRAWGYTPVGTANTEIDRSSTSGCFIADRDYDLVVLGTNDKDWRYDNVKRGDPLCTKSCEGVTNFIFAQKRGAPAQGPTPPMPTIPVPSIACPTCPVCPGVCSTTTSQSATVPYSLSTRVRNICVSEPN